MSQPIGHMLMASLAMNQVRPDLLKAYPSFMYLGSLGPDWFYTSLGGLDGYGEISDDLHHSGSSFMFKSMLDLAKEYNSNNQSREYEETISFAYGYISHVVADCIFHPYVNRRANNAWEKGQKHGESAHAGVETVIDNKLLETYSVPNFNLYCTDATKRGTVDDQIRQSMYRGMSGIYNTASWWNRMTEKTLDDYYHPFNLSYRACFQWDKFSDMGRLFHCNCNDLIQHLKGLTRQNVSIETGLNLERQPWCPEPNNEMLVESGMELFDLAIKSISASISFGETYIDQGLADFESSPVPFIRTDYNIDTGLPSAYNGEIFENLTGTDRFTYRTNILRENYDWASTLPTLDE